MVRQRLLVGVHWRPTAARPEVPGGDSAALLAATLEQLAALGAPFRGWHLDEDRPVVGVADLATALEEGRARSDDGHLMPHLGSLVSLVSAPGDPASATLRATVGVSAGRSAARVSASVVVSPTYRDPGESWHGALPDVLEVLVDVWSPQWGVAGTSAAREAQRDVLGVPGADLWTWLPGDLPQGLPAGVVVRPLAGGQLIDARGGGAADLDRVVQVSQALARAGHGLDAAPVR